MKKLIKAATIILVIAVLGTPTEYAGQIVKYVVSGLVVCLAIKYFWDLIDKKRKDNKFREYREHMILANKKAGDQLAKQFNAPITKTINYANERYIFISEPESLIMVDGVTFSFSQLLSCELADDQRNYSTTTTKEEKQSSSFLGWMINTDVGRVVDAINAPVTRSVNTASRTLHDYTLKLTLNSLSNPYLIIPLGDDEETKSYLKSIFDVIIHRNYDRK